MSDITQNRRASPPALLSGGAAARRRLTPAIAIIGLALLWPALTGLLSIYRTGTYAHCLFAAALWATLIIQHALYDAKDPNPARAWPLVLSVLSASLAFAAARAEIGLAAHLFVWAFCVCMIFHSFGAENKSTLCLAGFGLFAVPAGETLLPTLQAVAAQGSTPLINFIGVPVTRTGLILETPALSFVVDEGCAGLRYVVSATALASFIAIKRTWPLRHWIGFVSLAVAAGLAANIIRISTVVFVSQNNRAIADNHAFINSIAFVALLLFVAFGLSRLFTSDFKRR
ncbi:MAG: exosortase/archaeosortase family protein [Pseudomonadota bacterium]